MTGRSRRRWSTVMNDRVPGPPEAGDRGNVPDLSKDGLLSVMRSSHGPLREALRRAVADLEDKGDHYAAFGNTP
jgi:hypothetical protein